MRKPAKWAAGLLVLGAVLAIPGLPGQQQRTLAIAGHPGEVNVTEVNGRYLVEIDALRQLLNGSLTLTGHQYVLTVPAANSDDSSSAKAQTAGFSKEFLRTAIEQMSGIREWRSTLVNAVKRGYPITEDWTTAFASEAQQNLRLAAVAVSTESDRSVLQLLKNEFANMKKLSDRFVEANKARQYMAPTALDDDPLDARIRACAHSLASMAANGQFVDDGSCS